MKVVWICHFSNKTVREKLPLSKLSMLHFIRFLIGKKKKNYYNDFAPWITNLIKEFESFDNDVELHIISPFRGLKKGVYEFKHNNIYYHFFRSSLPFLHINVLGLFYKFKPKFIKNRFIIKNFIKKINPDIINLIGTENPYYSISTLDIKKIPVYVSAQTVYTNPDRKKHSGSYIQLNWDTEILIHKKEKYFGCMGRMHHDLILKNNPHAIIFKMFFPIERPKTFVEMSQKYDFVFFARGVVKKKGVEDAINALSLVKKEKEGVTLNIVGQCAPDYKKFLEEKIEELKLTRNIIFTDYFPEHSDLHQHLKQSHFALLPVKLDILPAAVIEAILLELPLVTYKTTGTPLLNKDKESVLLADIGDINMLAKQMSRLLTSPRLAEKIKYNAKEFIEKEFDNTTSAKRLLKNYKAVIENFKFNKPIPKDLLFDINEFPIY